MAQILKHADIEKIIICFLKKEIYDDSVYLDNQTDLIESGMDSFALLSLLMFIEKEFDIRIPQEEINETRMKNVNHLAALVYELKEKE